MIVCTIICRELTSMLEARIYIYILRIEGVNL